VVAEFLRVSARPFSITPQRAVEIFVVYMITQLACGVVGGGALGVIGAVIDQPTLINDHLPALLVAGNTLAFLYLYFRETKRASLSWGDLSWRLRDAVHLAGPVFVLAAAGVLVVSELTNLATLGVPNSGESILRQVMDLENYPILSPLLIVIVAPITEEILFRGLMLRGLLAVTTPKRAIALTTVLFMIVHLNPWQFPVAAVMGVLTGWVYLRSRSLLLCVGIHTVQNATALFASALPFTIQGFNQIGPNAGGFHPWWLDFAALGLLAFGAFWFHRTAPAAAPFVAAAPPPSPSEPPLLAPPPLTDPGAGI